MPKTRVQFWDQKFRDNVDRDRRQIEALAAAGWRTLVVWECETKSEANLAKLLDGRIKTERIENST